MKFIKPITITDSVLISSNIAETDYAPWNAATAYVIGDRVIRTGVHKIFERKVAGTTATAPESDTTNWFEVGYTNRWRMFDNSVGSISAKTTQLVVTLAPGVVINALYLGDLLATNVHVLMTDGAAGPTVFEKSYTLEDAADVLDYYDYFFMPPEIQTELIVEGIPPYSTGHITITIDAVTTAQCGTAVMGTMIELGGTLAGVGISITDYSTKSTDIYGVTSVVERGYAKVIDVPVIVDNAHIDRIAKRLASVRAVACIFIANQNGSNLSALIAYGLISWQLDITYPNHSEGRYKIEGLT